MNIFVAKLNARTTGEVLLAKFSEFGSVKSAKVIMDRETGRSKQFGFVEMDNAREALDAIQRLNDSELDGSRIVVKEAQPRGEGSSRGGTGYGSANRSGNYHPREGDKSRSTSNGHFFG